MTFTPSLNPRCAAPMIFCCILFYNYYWYYWFFILFISSPVLTSNFILASCLKQFLRDQHEISFFCYWWVQKHKNMHDLYLVPFLPFKDIINIMQNVVYLLRSRVVSGAPSGHNYVRISIYFSQFRLFLCLHYELSFWSWQIISFTSLFMSYSWATITARYTSNAFQKIQRTVQPSWKLHTLDQVC